MNPLLEALHENVVLLPPRQSRTRISWTVSVHDATMFTSLSASRTTLRFKDARQWYCFEAITTETKCYLEQRNMCNSWLSYAH